jgi:DNA-binding LytR/AlgR family response regulator
MSDEVQRTRFIVVDDERLARARMLQLIEAINTRRDGRHWQCVAEAENGEEALARIRKEKPDVVFLDVQMPGMQGIDVADILPQPSPLVVFVTAHEEYAVRAFDVHATDYLLKPVRSERLQRTMERLESMIAERTTSLHAVTDVSTAASASPHLRRITVHYNGAMRVLSVEDIVRFEAMDKGVIAVHNGSEYLCKHTLDELEKSLHPEVFLRAHRSHIVRIDTVREVLPWFSGTYSLKLSDGALIPIARRRAAEVKKLLG